MKKVFVWLLVAAASWGGYSFYRSRSSQPKVRAVEASQQGTTQPLETDAKPEAPNAGGFVTIVGPLAEWMQKDNRLHSTDEPTSQPRKPHACDHVAPSPVGTSSSVVRKTFPVTSTAKFIFEVPAHAASPQLHGTYRSFVRDSGVQSGDENANVDLLLMTDQQYANFLRGYPTDVLYSVDSSHEQDVSFGLPATFDRPAQYYLVFRSSSSTAVKRLVQADFRVDF